MQTNKRPQYLDANATTPLDPEVWEIMQHYFLEEFGNPGSRTHIYGQNARKGVEKARDQVATAMQCEADEVIFTSGATEANNLAILGLEAFGKESGKKHIITTNIEHKAVLEPLDLLKERGFEVTHLPVNKGCRINPADLERELREDTLLVSIMHVNNETGVEQPIIDCAKILKNHNAYFHVDAAQGFGKVLGVLENPRIDLISISGHKIYGPKGVGALILRSRDYEPPPLKPLMVGGGQEMGLRPGTPPTPLIAGLGKAAEVAIRDHSKRIERVIQQRKGVLKLLEELTYTFNGDQKYTLPHVLNISVEGWDSEAFMLAIKDVMAISNGSACTSEDFEVSHVLKAMFPYKNTINCLRVSI
jgi:cysteine desulfurase